MKSPAWQRERRGARVARRDDGAYLAYSTEEQRRPRGMYRRSRAAGLCHGLLVLAMLLLPTVAGAQEADWRTYLGDNVHRLHRDEREGE